MKRKQYEKLIELERCGEVFVLQKEYRTISIDGRAPRRYPCYYIPPNKWGPTEDTLIGAPCLVKDCWGQICWDESQDFETVVCHKEDDHRFRFVELEGKIYLVCIGSP